MAHFVLTNNKYKMKDIYAGDRRLNGIDISEYTGTLPTSEVFVKAFGISKKVVSVDDK